MRDYRFHCEDCDSYSQCQYYHNRKGTSLICKEFQYGSSVIEQIRDEIEAIEINGQVDEHTMFIRTGEQIKNMALEIIDKHIEGSK